MVLGVTHPELLSTYSLQFTKSMGLIEIYFGTITFIITLVGLAQGYSRELGRTMIILVVIFLLLFVNDQLNDILRTVGRLVFSFEELDTQRFFLSGFYQIMFILTVFAGYAGRTIVFPGQEMRAPQGSVLNLLVGALNGYLIAGSLWYYQHVYDYPLATIGWMNTNLSPIASELVNFLPQYMMPEPSLWVIPITVLILLRVRR